MSRHGEHVVRARSIIQPTATERERRRGTPEQRAAEMQAYWAEKAKERVPAWRRPREMRNMPKGPLLRNRPEVVASYRAMPYAEYLQTDWWRTIKRAAICRAGYRCQNCGQSKPLDVHHKTYERLGTEADDDLTALCRLCHDLEHSQQPNTHH